MRPGVRGRAALLLSLAGVAGCAVDQTAEVRAYRSMVDLGTVPALREDEALTLTHALLLTNAVNERLSIEGETYLQAMIERQRRAAFLRPTLDLFGGLIVRENTGGGGTGDGNGAGSGTVLFDGGLNAQYTLLTGWSDFRRARAADLRIEQRRWLLLDLRETLLLETALSYYGVLLAERQVGVLESSLTVQEERLRDIRGRQEVGFARPLDVAQIESQVSETRVLLLDALNAAQTGRIGLAFLTGVPLEGRLLSDGFEPPASDFEPAALILIADANRQDLAAAVDAAGAARQEVDAAIGEYYPTVGLDLDYFLTRDTVPTDRDWSGFLAVRLPLFAAGRIEANVRDAWSRFRQAVLAHSLTRRRVARDVSVAYADWTSTRSRVGEVRQQVRAAEESLRQAEAAYGAGLGTNLERIAAQDQVLASQLRLAREEFSAKVAYLAMCRAAGWLTQAITGTALDAATAAAARPAPESPFVVLPGSPVAGGSGIGTRTELERDHPPAP